MKANITLHNISTLTDKQRRDIVEWLEDILRNIEDYPEKFPKIYKSEL